MIITRAIGAHYKKAFRHFLLEGEELQTASVSVIQRFGGALNLNIHFSGQALKRAKDFAVTLRGTRITSCSPPISPVLTPLGKAWGG